MSDFDAEQNAGAMGSGSRPSLRGKFLLASQSLAEPNFARTVILLVRHDEDGAIGLVLNRPLGVSLDEACSEEVEAARGVDVPLFHGGPCAGPLVAVHNIEQLAREEAELVSPIDSGFGEEEKEPWAEPVMKGVWFCARREALEALMRHVRAQIERQREAEEAGEPSEASAAGHEPLAVKFVAGYAGWGAGQLELELAEGAWQIADASMADVYAGGSPRFPAPPPTTALPPGAVGLLSLLSQAIQGDHDPSAALASGIRQWVRLSTRTNLRQMVNDRLIPDDPTVN